MPEKFGSYTVYEEIGIGGTASVHVAKTRDGKRVALKRLLSHVAMDADAARTFRDEANLVRRLKHPNIAATYEFGEVDGTYYIAMEYVPGYTLTRVIQQCGTTIGVIPFPITVNILIQLCDALEYAHNLRDESGKPLRIIHRDVSPQNVILSTTGIVKLIDFGIAKATSSTVHSHVGVVKGKFGYMAPEYLKGKLDSRCDLWAIGTVAHELLTNKRLFKGEDDFKTMYAVRYADIDPPSHTNPDVPSDFDVIVMTALEREPDRRWQSAGAMRTALANAAQELRTIVTNAQLIEWVEWTFSQAPPQEGSELSKLIQVLSGSTAVSISLSVPVTELADVAQVEQELQDEDEDESVTNVVGAAHELTPLPVAPDRVLKPAGRDAQPTVRPIAQPTARPVAQRRGTSLLRVVLLLLLLLAAGAYAAYYYDYLPPEVTELLPTFD